MSSQSGQRSGRGGMAPGGVDAMLRKSAAYRSLGESNQAEVRDALLRVSEVLSHRPERVVRALAGEPESPAQPAGGGGSTTGRVGEVARATLNAIDFPAFVASLIQGTFQAIVDASIQQMEAYAELLKNVASTVDQFMEEHISEGDAQDYLADRYPDTFGRDTTGGQPQLTVAPDNGSGAMPGFLRELGFDSLDQLDEEAVQTQVVPAARRTMAEMRHQTLATMVLMGLNRIVVDDGEIKAKLMFHVDASETTSLRFDQTKNSGMNMSGRAGRNPFTANGILVNTTNVNAQSDINVRADLTGEVRVRFRSDVMPLERFADSGAIQLINQNAKVPQPMPRAGGDGDRAAAPAEGAARPASAPVVSTAGLDGDPWAPRRAR